MVSCQEKETENMRIEMDKALKKLRDSEKRSCICIYSNINQYSGFVCTVHTRTCDKSFQINKIDPANEHYQSEEETVISSEDESTPYLEISADEQSLFAKPKHRRN